MSEKAGARTGFSVRAQYVKDLSFENPAAAHMSAAAEPPKTRVTVGVDGRAGGDGLHEVVLRIDVRATRGDEVAFLLELAYAGLFHIVGVAEDRLRPLAMVECPRFLFPFARRIVADCIRDGGFPPFLIDPIDFGVLFRRSEHARQAAGDGDGDGGGGDRPATTVH